MTKDLTVDTLVRDEVKCLLPYEPHDYPDLIKLDANENPYSFPREVMERLAKELARNGLPRYPDPLSRELREALAAYTGLEPRNTLAGNGSDELIQLILLTFGGNGKRVIIPSPTFVMYQIHSTITGAVPIEVPLTEAFDLDMAPLLNEIAHPDTKVVFLCTPNNPSGNLIPLDQIKEVLDRAKCLVVVDEAYFEFGGKTVIPLLQEYKNLVILRTFSKAFALAGLRVGYLLANEEVIRELTKVKQPYNLNTFSQRAALAVLEHRAVFEDLISLIITERDRLFAEMKNIAGIHLFPTGANFILFRTIKPASEVHQELVEGGVLIRNLSNVAGLANCLRVTVGKKEENDIFLAKLKKIMA